MRKIKILFRRLTFLNIEVAVSFFRYHDRIFISYAAGAFQIKPRFNRDDHAVLQNDVVVFSLKFYPREFVRLSGRYRVLGCVK